jgi:hypothetical protein
MWWFVAIRIEIEDGLRQLHAYGYAPRASRPQPVPLVIKASFKLKKKNKKIRAELSFDPLVTASGFKPETF